jgi:phosphotransferase system HPr (HPr) family protein
MGVLMLAAERGSHIHIRCEGDDADRALEELSALVARGFEED